jgi:prevent-host-death family protein
MPQLSHALLVAGDKDRAEAVAELERAGMAVSLARDHSTAIELLRRSANGFDLLISSFTSAPESKALVKDVRALSADLTIVVVIETEASIEPWDQRVHWFRKSRGPKALVETAANWRDRDSQAAPGQAKSIDWFLTSGRQGTPQTVTATEAKNQLPELLDQAAQRGPVFITKHQKPKGVLLGIDEYRALSGAGARRLAALTEEFDALLTQMQEPSMPGRLKSAFESSPEAIGRAALAAEKRR